MDSLHFLQQMLNSQPLDMNVTIDYPLGEYDALKEPAWIGVTVTLYIIVILLGVVGNGTIIFVVFRHKYMRTVTNIFICNLAMADLGLCLFNLPIQLHYQVTQSWAFGDILCHVILATFGVPLFVSTLTFLLIAFDRYYLIVYPLRSHIKMKTACLLIVSIAIIALSISIPVMVYAQTEHLVEPLLHMNKVMCIETMPTAKKQIYSVVMFLLKLVLPVLIAAGLYGRIYVQLCHRPLGTRDARRNQRRKRTCKILVAIVTVFMVSWLPWSIFNLVADFMSHDQILLRFGKYFQLADLYLKLFAMTSTCINPFLYGWLNENFRKEIDVILGRRAQDTLTRARNSCTVDRSEITAGMRSKIDSLLYDVVTNKNGDVTSTTGTEQVVSDTTADKSQLLQNHERNNCRLEENGNDEKLIQNCNIKEQDND